MTRVQVYLTLVSAFTDVALRRAPEFSASVAEGVDEAKAPDTENTTLEFGTASRSAVPVLVDDPAKEAIGQDTTFGIGLLFRALLSPSLSAPQRSNIQAGLVNLLALASASQVRHPLLLKCLSGVGMKASAEDARHRLQLAQAVLAALADASPMTLAEGSCWRVDHVQRKLAPHPALVYVLQNTPCLDVIC